MAEWLADNRAMFALITIIGLLIAFVWSIRIGVQQTRLRARDEVFGDPERTKGGWYWAVCGCLGTNAGVVLLFLGHGARGLPECCQRTVPGGQDR